jgi:ABC-type lipoprotein export system ATPase subunit
MEPIVKLCDIHKTYQMGDIAVPVLKGVSLTVARGEMVALMGTSGSGKSTLMNILGCLDRPDSGSYWLDGEEVSQLSANQRALLRNRKLGFVFQNFSLLPRTSALDNVAMPLLYAAGHISERDSRHRATEMLGRVGLQDRLNYEPSRLSGGQQQRVAIARALINRPSAHRQPRFDYQQRGSRDDSATQSKRRHYHHYGHPRRHGGPACRAPHPHP